MSAGILADIKTLKEELSVLEAREFDLLREKACYGPSEARQSELSYVREQIEEILEERNYLFDLLTIKPKICEYD
jgi:hypothetical protein